MRDADHALPDPVAGPVSNAARFVSLDVLRGFSVLGILVMNIYFFAMPFAAYSNPLAWGGAEPYNVGTWIVTHIFFDQKFMTIFSMLFGAGIVLMHERALSKNVAFGRIFYRRQLWLLIIGLVHAYLVWAGDILFFYAVVGMIVYAFRNFAPRRLLVIGCVLLAVAPLLAFGGGAYMQDLKLRTLSLELRQAEGQTLTDEEVATIQEWSDVRPMLLPGDAEIAAEVAAYRGNYRDSLRHRVEFVKSFQVDGLLFFVLWRVGGLMLIGMALVKTGVLSGERTRAFYRRLMLTGYAVGLPITAISALNAHAHGYDPLYMFQIGNTVNYVGSIVVALGHVGLVMLAVSSGWCKSLAVRFAAVGQMALTSYLTHSVVMTALFYGWGLGLYGQVPRLGQMAFVAGLIGLQLAISPWWLARYRFGPVEWLWRSLTYWRRQPLRCATRPRSGPGGG